MAKRIQFALNIITTLLVVFHFMLPPSRASASGIGTLVISEVKVRNDTTGYDEFIELYNASTEAQDLGEFELQYFNTTNPTSSHQPANAAIDISNHRVLPPGKFFTLAKNPAQIPNAKPSPFSSLADSGGRLKLANQSGDVVSEVAWTNTTTQAIEPIVLVTSSNSVGKSISMENGSDGLPQTGGIFALASSSPLSRVLDAAPQEPNEDELPPTTDPIPTYRAVEITELLVDPVSPQTDGNDEFVELHNPYGDTLNLDGYTIKTGTNLQYQYVLVDIVLAPDQYMAFYSGDGNITLSNSGGNVQVVLPNDDAGSELITYPESEAGQSWAKIDNLWQWTNIVTPGDVNSPSINNLGGDRPSTPAKAVLSNRDYPSLVITELMVDPAAPSLDSQDEYIELYNPNAQPVNLKGYVLRTGASLKTKYNLSETLIQPGEYLAFYGRNSNISLSNNGGSARLDDGSEHIISQAENYEKAEVGDAWALIDGMWKWTSSPTPNAPNIFSISSKETKKAKAAAAAKSKTNTKTAQAKAAQSITKPAAVPASPLSIGIIATASGLALLYGLYEFRYDLHNRFELFRRYIKNRWHSGP